MSRRALLRTLRQARTGSNNIRFQDLVALVEAYGFRFSRISGSHHIFAHREVPEQVNLQERGGKAKAYQVRQFMQIVDDYGLEL
ncbi:MAG TPA: type II toxin-antitoxin system HicA family toxin [Chloroflexia bacterium]|nr:type II toxin-antitoxin system HicA family toxin [Chloroflexia bacterium]